SIQPRSFINAARLTSVKPLLIGCIEAMNLDGGGSSQLAANGTLINRPEGGTFQRPVPTILAVVHRDSLPDAQPMGFEDIIDTGDSRAELLGSGWFQSANPGFYGSTPSELNSVGTGDNIAVFRPNLGFSDSLEVFAWWVAAGNRSMDTPVVVRHLNGIDTVRVNQTLNGSSWNYLGKWVFAGDTSDAIIISNAATSGSFVVADAIQLTGDALTGIDSQTASVLPSGNVLLQNYPNPFNPSTTLTWQLEQPAQVKIEVFNTLGQRIDQLLDSQQQPGNHSLIWHTNGDQEYVSGIYLIRMQATDLDGMQYISSRKALLIR
ncbi:MAG: phosphodiester glycosidase family protein, partial [Calditrichota bacterium]